MRYELVYETLGKTWELHGIAVKPYPICHFIHAAADSALLLRDKHGIRPEDIERVVALVPEPTLHIIAEPRAIKLRPANEYDAKFSTPMGAPRC